MKDYWFTAYDIPNPDESLPSQQNWRDLTQEERQRSNKLWSEHSLDTRPDNRADPDLVAVVEKLGDKANGRYARLRVVEIPDGTDYEIDEYDGQESIHEKHRSWG